DGACAIGRACHAVQPRSRRKWPRYVLESQPSVRHSEHQCRGEPPGLADFLCQRFLADVLCRAHDSAALAFDPPAWGVSRRAAGRGVARGRLRSGEGAWRGKTPIAHPKAAKPIVPIIMAISPRIYARARARFWPKRAWRV